MKSSLKNAHDTRESWLRAATNDLRSFFGHCGYPIPPNIRFAIAFPSTGRRGARVGECWHGSTSDDGSFEIIIRADIADPVEVLGVLAHELIHACLPADAGHGKLYRDAALRLGLEGKMRQAMPGELLKTRLVQIAEALGDLPHAKLNIERGRDNKRPADQPKKQRTRMLKAECDGVGCGYTVRLTAKWAKELGANCPKHGAMTIHFPVDEDEDDEADVGAEGVAEDFQEEAPRAFKRSRA
jgi:hypothetical protein